MFLRCPLPLFNSTFFSLAGGSDCKTFASVLQWCSKHNDEPKGSSLCLMAMTCHYCRLMQLESLVVHLYVTRRCQIKGLTALHALCVTDS